MAGDDRNTTRRSVEVEEAVRSLQQLYLIKGRENPRDADFSNIPQFAQPVRLEPRLEGFIEEVMDRFELEPYAREQVKPEAPSYVSWAFENSAEANMEVNAHFAVRQARDDLLIRPLLCKICRARPSFWRMEVPKSEQSLVSWQMDDQLESGRSGQVVDALDDYELVLSPEEVAAIREQAALAPSFPATAHVRVKSFHGQERIPQVWALDLACPPFESLLVAAKILEQELSDNEPLLCLDMGLGTGEQLLSALLPYRNVFSISSSRPPPPIEMLRGRFPGARRYPSWGEGGSAPAQYLAGILEEEVEVPGMVVNLPSPGVDALVREVVEWESAFFAGQTLDLHVSSVLDVARQNREGWALRAELYPWLAAKIDAHLEDEGLIVVLGDVDSGAIHHLAKHLKDHGFARCDGYQGSPATVQVDYCREPWTVLPGFHQTGRLVSAFRRPR